MVVVFLVQRYEWWRILTRFGNYLENYTNFALFNRIKLLTIGFEKPANRMRLHMDTLDKVDLQILRTLQGNARLTTKELASRVSLSSTPVFERLKRLENNGYIKKYIAVLDAEKLNQGFIVFCNVKMNRLSREIAQDFTEIIRNIPEVTECYNISGSFDYLLKIHAPNMKYYQEFVLNVLGTIENLGSLESTFVMDEIKHEYGIHI